MISSKLNCFTKQAGLFDDQLTFARNCPRNDNGDEELTACRSTSDKAPGDREPWIRVSDHKKDWLCADGKSTRNRWEHRSTVIDNRIDAEGLKEGIGCMPMDGTCRC